MLGLVVRLFLAFVLSVIGRVATSSGVSKTVHPPPTDLWGTVRSATANPRSDALRQRSGPIVTFSRQPPQSHQQLRLHHRSACVLCVLFVVRAR